MSLIGRNENTVMPKVLCFITFSSQSNRAFKHDVLDSPPKLLTIS